MVGEVAVSYPAVTNPEGKAQQEEMVRSLPFYPATDLLGMMLKEVLSRLPKHIH